MNTKKKLVSAGCLVLLLAFAGWMMIHSSAQAQGIQSYQPQSLRPEIIYLPPGKKFVSYNADNTYTVRDREANEKIQSFDIIKYGNSIYHPWTLQAVLQEH